MSDQEPPPEGKPLFEIFTEKKVPDLMKTLRSGPYNTVLPKERVRYILSAWMQAIDNRGHANITSGAEGSTAFSEAMAWALKEIGVGK